MIPSGIATGVLIGCFLGLVYINRELTRMVRLALRREHVLLRAARTYDELLRRGVTGTLDEDELRLGMQLIEAGQVDELHAQAHVRRWQRVPKVGKPWPDSLLGSVLDEDEVAA